MEEEQGCCEHSVREGSSECWAKWPLVGTPPIPHPSDFIPLSIAPFDPQMSPDTAFHSIGGTYAVPLVSAQHQAHSKRRAKSRPVHLIVPLTWGREGKV